jgi:hypothetical protein
VFNRIGKLCKAPCLAIAVCFMASLVPGSARAGDGEGLHNRFPDFMLKHKPGAWHGTTDPAGTPPDLAGFPVRLRDGSAADSLKTPAIVPKGAGRNSKIIGSSCFASGLALCSWGIASWQVREFQDCPPRNTENVIKIVVGVVLINAGLIFLLGGAD